MGRSKESRFYFPCPGFLILPHSRAQGRVSLKCTQKSRGPGKKYGGWPLLGAGAGMDLQPPTAEQVCGRKGVSSTRQMRNNSSTCGINEITCFQGNATLGRWFSWVDSLVAVQSQANSFPFSPTSSVKWRSGMCSLWSGMAGGGLCSQTNWAGICHCPVAAVNLENYLASEHLSFLICKVAVIILTSEGYC